MMGDYRENLEAFVNAFKEFIDKLVERLASVPVEAQPSFNDDKPSDEDNTSVSL